jgi:hypothetical protein
LSGQRRSLALALDSGEPAEKDPVEYLPEPIEEVSEYGSAAVKSVESGIATYDPDGEANEFGAPDPAGG